MIASPSRRLLAALPLLAAVLFFAPAAFAFEAGATGTFVGKSNHVTTGTVTIVKSDGVTKIVFADDFSLDGAPDPKVGFGNNGFVEGSLIGKLKALNGAQEYVVPEGVDLSKFNEVHVWCEKFSVPLGVAKIK